MLGPRRAQPRRRSPSQPSRLGWPWPHGCAASNPRGAFKLAGGLTPARSPGLQLYAAATSSSSRHRIIDITPAGGRATRRRRACRCQAASESTAAPADPTLDAGGWPGSGRASGLSLSQSRCPLMLRHRDTEIRARDGLADLKRPGQYAAAAAASHG